MTAASVTPGAGRVPIAGPAGTIDPGYVPSGATGAALLATATQAAARDALGLGSLALASAVTAAQISDATTAGRALLTAADAADQRAALGALALHDQAQTWTAAQAIHAPSTPLKAWVEGVYDTGNSTVGDIEEIGRFGDGRGAIGSHRLSFFRRRGPGPGGGTGWELTQLGIGRIVDSTWFGSLRFGSDTAHDHIVATCGAFGVGVEPLIAAGRIQLPIGTTIGDGMRYGDIHQYRAGAHLMRFDYNDPSAQVEIANNGTAGGYSCYRAFSTAPGAGGNVVLYAVPVAIGAEGGGVGTDSNHGFQIRTNGQGRIRIGALGELHFAGQTPVARPTLPAAATDAATTQDLANALRLLLLNNGLAA